MRYAWIKTQSGHSVRTLCAVLDVSTSGYYACQRRQPSARAIDGVRLLQQIERIHIENREAYGTPPIGFGALPRPCRSSRFVHRTPLSNPGFGTCSLRLSRGRARSKKVTGTYDEKRRAAIDAARNYGSCAASREAACSSSRMAGVHTLQRCPPGRTRTWSRGSNGTINAIASRRLSWAP